MQLTLLVVGLTAAVLLLLSTHLALRHTNDLREMAHSRLETIRADLRTKGVTVVRNMALAFQRAVATLDFLFLVEIVRSTVDHDPEVLYGIVMDGHGRVIVNYPAAKGSQYLNGKDDRRALAALEPTVLEVTMDGVPIMEAVAPILTGSERWGTVRLGLSLASLDRATAESERLIRQKTHRTVALTVGSTLAILLVASYVGMRFARRLVLRPVAGLMTGIQHMQQGVLHQPVAPLGSAEFVELATAFNSMSDTIRSDSESLRHLNTALRGEVDERTRAQQALEKLAAELELRVEQRTLELSTANEDLSEEVARRRRAEQQLTAYADRLKESNQALTDFAYVASHDLQEPLRKVLAFGDRLRVECEAQLTGAGGDYLARMRNAAERMRTLITELLAYSRVTTNVRPFATVDLGKLVKEVLADLEVAIDTKHATVAVADLPVLAADPLQMRQLFQNLIGNALKFIPADRAPRIEVATCSPSELPAGLRGPLADFVQITVADNGVGFEDKHADRIFGVFVRLHSHAEYEGTGMGLAICRRIVERHGGRIIARGVPNQGATFVITLPKSGPSQGKSDEG